MSDLELDTVDFSSGLASFIDLVFDASSFTSLVAVVVLASLVAVEVLVSLVAVVVLVSLVAVEVLVSLVAGTSVERGASRTAPEATT